MYPEHCSKPALLFFVQFWQSNELGIANRFSHITVRLESLNEKRKLIAMVCFDCHSLVKSLWMKVPRETATLLLVLHARRPVNELKKSNICWPCIGSTHVTSLNNDKKESINTRCIHFLLPQNVKLTHYMTQSIRRHVQSSSTWVCIVTLMFTSYWRIRIHVQKLHAHRVNRRHYLVEPTQWNSSNLRLYIQYYTP